TMAAFIIHGETPYLAMGLFTAMFGGVMMMTARSLADGVFGSLRLETRLRDSIESLSDGFIVYDQRERVVIWNKHLVEILPYLKGKIGAGTTLRQVFRLAADWPARAIPKHEREAWIESQVAAVRQRNRNAYLNLPTGQILELSERQTAEGGW